MLGVALDTIRSIENERIGLSDEMATKIANATGCDPKCLRELHTRWLMKEIKIFDPQLGYEVPMDYHFIEVSGIGVFDQFGNPYTEESYSRWIEIQKSESTGAQDRSKHVLDELTLRLAAFFEAAKRVGKEVNAQEHIWKALDDGLESFNLAAPALRILKEAGDWPRSKWREIVPPGKTPIYGTNRGEVVFLTGAEMRTQKVLLDLFKQPAQAESSPSPPAPPAAEHPKTAKLRPALPARGSAGKASSGPRARVARKSPRRS